MNHNSKRELRERIGKVHAYDFEGNDSNLEIMIPAALGDSILDHITNVAAEIIERDKADDERYARSNEHHVISGILTNTDIANLSPETVRRLKDRKKELRKK